MLSKRSESRKKILGSIFIGFVTIGIAYGNQWDYRPTYFSRLGGSYRTYATSSFYTELPPFFLPCERIWQSVLRLTVEGRPLGWLSYDFHLVQDLTAANIALDQVYALRLEDERYRGLDTSWNLYEKEKLRTAVRLDRMNVKIALPWLDITLGRQAVTFGKAYFWNPLDVFLPFKSIQMDRDYKTGIDGIRVDLPLGLYSGINLLCIAGKEIYFDDSFAQTRVSPNVSWYGSAMLIRYFTTNKEWDLSFQAGKIYGGYHTGGGMTGELGPLEFRMEAAYFFSQKQISLPDPLPDKLLDDYLTAVFGIGRRFDNGLLVEIEVFLNGRAQTEYLESALLRLVHGSNDHLSTRLLGTMLSYDLLPIINSRLVWIYSLSDRTSLFQPSLSISLTDESDLILGGNICLGETPYLSQNQYPRILSEFGTYPDVLYLEYRIYF